MDDNVSSITISLLIVTASSMVELSYVLKAMVKSIPMAKPELNVSFSTWKPP